MSGCLGRCCAAFPLSADVEYLWLHMHHITDGEQIAAMLIPLTHAEARARLARVGSTMTVADDDREYFTCRHWHPGTRRCLIYEDRPAMCRSYPPPAKPGSLSCDHGCPHVEAPAA